MVLLHPSKRLASALSLLASLLILSFLAGCGGRETLTSPDGKALKRVVLQTDWFPQPEHGGFYQALAKGFYKEAGLDVVILPGGPNAMSTQKVLKGQAHFAMNRADTIYSLAARKVPLLMVMATLQNDPQALLLHAGNPIDRFEQLDGEQVMAVPGLTWVRWLEARYGIELEIIPHDFGLERFINDPTFIQQCLLTNEPYYVREAGVEAKVLPLRESGFNPPHGIYCLQETALEDPEMVARFVQASVRGWRDFIVNDPSPAFALIAELNPKMTPGFMDFSRNTLIREGLVTDKGSGTGFLEPVRMDRLVRELHELGIVDRANQPEEPWFTNRFLEDLSLGDGPSGALP
ncbi:MAG TPA: ABC transporter substrate-binding protein [Oceanipulchritudo sp.]|nr:ABC transporter substrate-binding protein [Oceanipulchritudo sp.]